MKKITQTDLRTMWAEMKAEYGSKYSLSQLDSLINADATKITYCHTSETPGYQSNGWRRTTLQVLREIWPDETWI